MAPTLNVISKILAFAMTLTLFLAQRRKPGLATTPNRLRCRRQRRDRWRWLGAGNCAPTGRDAEIVAALMPRIVSTPVPHAGLRHQQRYVL